MSYTEKLREQSSPPMMLLVLAEGLDAILARIEQIDTQLGQTTANEWTEWQDGTTSFSVEHDEDNGESTITFAEVGEELQEQRAKFARDVLRLHENYTDGEQYIDGYAKGGPMYLYLSDRDFVMGLPDIVKQQMLTDLNSQDAEAARDMAADILKDTSPGSAETFLSQREELQAE